MISRLKICALIYFSIITIGCTNNLVEKQLRAKQDYKVTIRENQKDSTFKIATTDNAENYTTELWVSDPECTECKDCYVDSGKVIIPKVLKQFVKMGEKDLILTCDNPYEIEQEAYIKYKLRGHVSGVKNGYLIFCVSDWQRRK